MSRIGKNPCAIPDGVTVNLSGQSISVKGKLGELSLTLTDDVEASLEDNQLWVKPNGDNIQARKMWGTARALVGNMVTGVSSGFSKKLDIQGVGYRAAVKGKNLELQQENVTAEQKKYENGMSTSFLVLQAQDALRNAERRENLSIIDYNKSLVSLEQSKGTLLEARQINMMDMGTVPGGYAPGSYGVGMTGSGGPGR